MNHEEAILDVFRAKKVKKGGSLSHGAMTIPLHQYTEYAAADCEAAIDSLVARGTLSADETRSRFKLEVDLS